ncbi:hypothetical protein ASPACDRAFT_122206 [Aspergillus aculeatus ATCC 16872]|uniref:DUF6536 domain-containing protein n=1 Tax=Aspergillus aculeatus (strain ATCC 16872 / CBS 172.66 / WB 5094) TaxID=690307 RepID=A0A1L9WQI3_ASPA1|nr:uncharacterized protein ASPACDRAFT_122206 [Aspergillus aculeatus ATCC 16872]OJJ98412.1 hypothetical protein ASPACDRAFT_122206 [Aspergillus aculeatus ATCC 16872]
MGVDSDPVHVTVEGSRPPSAWREQFRYSSIPDETQGKKGRWADLSSRFKLLGKTEEGSEWIRGALICTWITGTILAVNIIMLLVATVIAYRGQWKTNRGQFQMAELYSGQCSRSSHWATGLHVIINVFSTILLGASNYVMQCLGAPSRTDIDRAHAKSRWLDVGTFSFRNFAVMDRRRKILWLLLMVSSTPIHMIYNSVIFSSISTLDYGIFMIPDDLSPTETLIGNDTTSRDSFLSEVGSEADVVRMQIFNGTFVNATAKDCTTKYNVEYNTEYGTLIYVAGRQHFHNTSSLQLGGFERYASVYEIMQGLDGNPPPNASNLTLTSEYWSYRIWNYSVPDPLDGNVSYINLVGPAYEDMVLSGNASLSADLYTLAEYNYAYNPSYGALRVYLDTPSHWKNSSWAAAVTFELLGTGSMSDFYTIDQTGVREVPVSHCLIKEEEQRCQLFFSPPIAIVVIVCNIIKVVCMLLTARVKRTDLMLRVGDALASFLTRPDPTTRGRCLLSRSQMTRGPQAWTLPGIVIGSWKGYTLQRRAPSPTSHSLDNLSSTITTKDTKVYPSILPLRKRWYQAVSWQRWTLVLLFFIACIVTAIWLTTYAISQTEGFSTAMSLGFAQTSATTMIQYISSNMIALVLLANTPQIILSILYFLSNSLLTCMLVAEEWDQYALHRRPLRVSWPRGQQQSSYYLSLRYRYSLPLMILSATLHWLLSQSIFFVNIKAYDVYGDEDEGNSSRGCCYSPMAMFITMWVGILALGLLVSLGARRFKSHMPLATHCSAAISAACHPPEGDDMAAGKPVMWGEIPRKAETRVTMPTPEYPWAAERTDGDEPYGHCSFTSWDVVTPSLVKLYY